MSMGRKNIFVTSFALAIWPLENEGDSKLY
jgi:hypothetical protein